MAIITLTSDFGPRDYYVGAMKGVILSIAPETTLVDLSHAIGAQDLLEGAFVLSHAAREFPPGTVHLAVVDPGVGTARRAIAFASGGHLWVGPDNGLLSFALAHSADPVRQINHANLTSRIQSSTFHGRDLFAPTAAHLANGFALDEIGPVVADPILLPGVAPQQQRDLITGQIIHVDHFGNLVSNITTADLADFSSLPVIRIGDHPPLDRLSTTYADVEPGQCLALIGSAGLLEIAVNGGSASAELGADRRTTIKVSTS